MILSWEEERGRGSFIIKVYMILSWEEERGRGFESGEESSIIGAELLE